MITSPESIRIFLEVGKRLVLRARGVSALVLATGIGAAVVAVASRISTAPRKAHEWVTRKITE